MKNETTKEEETMNITPALLREWEACWTDARIAEHYGPRTVLAPREIAEDATIDREDRLWVLCKTLWHLDESATRTFAIDSAALVSHLAGRPEDQAEHARLVSDLRRIYAIPAGPGRKELRRWTTAWGAARTASWGTARAAAWDVARDAAWDAAWIAAWGATRAVAWDATWDARDAARAAARAATWTDARAAARAAWDAELDKAIQRAIAAIEMLLSSRTAVAP